MFVAGLLLGVVGAAALFNAGRDSDDGPAERAATAPQSSVMGAAAAPAVRCSFGQIVSAAGREDGLLPLDKDLQGRSASAVTTLLTTGKEAAAAGKQRDAETAFLMACRSAETLKNDAIPLADAHYQLGRHYAQVAASPNAANRDEMLKRAQALYGSALQAYTTHRGADHERTRFAREGLQSLQQMAGGALPAPAVAAAAAPAPAPAPAPSPAPAPAPSPAPDPAPLPPIQIPQGQYPRPGTCRIWVPGVSPGQQQPAGDCATLEQRVPEGAYLIRG